ncbi:hypothetical protein DYBT9275_05445 [Dyadobacter sp. CECT 9275]|uniref:DUF6268 domain-containing protein n=1 Tax=Dyadobacter helix TaxID=2822344 RepID=A0A916JHG3_9BACT|nr:DUF6268 family outer membrane beta-barrel protein [Dyadobacter sp. CECT 9275]CAG5015935.1 hypothetical protein DYBT9275_05445 [Dyadobacter sp. CECT 9275]
MLKNLFHCLQLLLLASAVLAQDRDLATVHYAVAGMKYNDTTAHTAQLDVKLRIPLYQKKKIVAGATLGYKQVNLFNLPADYANPLYGFTCQGAWLYKVTPRRSLALFVQAGLFTDVKDISGKDFRYSAGFRYRLKHSEKLSTGWGLAYSRQFFGNQLVPFIDVDYRPSEQWSISGQFPVKPKILYRFTRKLSIGLELNGEAASYRLSAAARENEFIQINQWTGLSRLEYQFANAWQLYFGIGRSLKQSYKLFDDASQTRWTIITVPIGDKPSPQRKIDSAGLYLQLGISFGLSGN